jgi:hypothetical protein
MDATRYFAGVSRRVHIIVSATLLSGASILWSGSTVVAAPPPPFKHVLSSGTFILPPNAQSVDWVLLNDSPGARSVRVTVYNVLIGVPKTKVGPVVATTVAPSSATHNANSVSSTGIFKPGGMYEVVVELNDLRVLPAVDVWSENFAELIPGTHITPREFSQIK